jgi:hypothetical protein
MALWGRHYVAQLYDSNLVVPIREMALRGSRGDVQNAAQLALAAIVNRAGPLHLRYLVQHRLVQAFAVVIGMPHRSTEVLTYTLKAVRRVMSQPLLRRAAWHNFCDPPGRGDDALGRLYADEKCDEQVRKSATACLDQYGGTNTIGAGGVPASEAALSEDAVVAGLAEINQVLGDADDGRIRAAAAIASATANANGGFGGGGFGGGGGASKPDPESKQRWEGLFGVPYLGDQTNGGGGGESKNERDGGQRSSPTGGGGGGDGDEEEDDDDENDEEYAEEDDRDYEGDPRDEEHLTGQLEQLPPSALSSLSSSSSSSSSSSPSSSFSAPPSSFPFSSTLLSSLSSPPPPPGTSPSTPPTEAPRGGWGGFGGFGHLGPSGGGGDPGVGERPRDYRLFPVAPPPPPPPPPPTGTAPWSHSAPLGFPSRPTGFPPPPPPSPSPSGFSFGVAGLSALSALATSTPLSPEQRLWFSS